MLTVDELVPLLYRGWYSIFVGQQEEMFAGEPTRVMILTDRNGVHTAKYETYKAAVVKIAGRARGVHEAYIQHLSAPDGESERERRDALLLPE
jgi:hypothetical protein